MKIKRKLLIIIISFLLIGCSTINMKENIPYERFKGGRFGYSHNILNIYSDSTYYYSEWMHTGRSIKDIGIIKYDNGKTYLNSTRTENKYRKSKTSSNLKFVKEEFLIKGDSILLVPKNKNNIQYNKEYYTLIKEKQSQCFNEKIIDFGGSFNFAEYSFKCPTYRFSENAKASTEWKILDPNNIEKVSNIINPIRKKIEKEILEFSGNEFIKHLEFSSVSINYPDSISKFKGVPEIKDKKCKAKYFFYYYFKPKRNVKYCIGIPVNEKGKRMSKFNFPSKSEFKKLDEKLDVCEVIRLAKVFEKNIDPIKEVSFEYDNENKVFYWLITQERKLIKRNNGYFDKYNIVKINASNGSLISKHKIKGRVLPNMRFF